MRKRLAAVIFAVLASAGMASAQPVSTNFVMNANALVPDGDPNGLALTTTLGGLSGTISDVSLTLNISGGNNSDLYAYLVGPNGGFAILLNRVGLGAANPHGYEDSGFSITLSDDGARNVHEYQEGAYTLNGARQLTGTWTPDGRNIDPQSSPALFDSAIAAATLSSFGGTDPNGVWTLYFADLSGGGDSTLESWQVNLRVIPEPGTAALFCLGGLAVLSFRRRGK